MEADTVLASFLATVALNAPKEAGNVLFTNIETVAANVDIDDGRDLLVILAMPPVNAIVLALRVFCPMRTTKPTKLLIPAAIPALVVNLRSVAASEDTVAANTFCGKLVTTPEKADMELVRT
jgi:hypothetical protein